MTKQKPLVNVVVAKRSTWKAIASTLVLVVATAFAGALADLLVDTDFLKTIMREGLWFFIPTINLFGQFIKDYTKHS